MKFSILIANYNNGKYFADCYKSIINQTYNNWEAIIVDDGSTDDSLDLIRKLIQDDERFKLYTNTENKGCGYTKRKCAELATGEIAGFLDPDDALLPDAVIKMMDVFENRSDLVLVHSLLFHCDKYLNVKDLYSQGDVVSNEKKDFFNWENKVTAFSAFQMKAYRKTSGINENMIRAVDQDLYLKLAEKGKFYFLNEPLYLYRRHEMGISAASNNAKKAQFWHLVAAMDAAKRRQLNLEDYFLYSFVNRKESLKLNKITTGKAGSSFYLKLFIKSIKQKFSNVKDD